MAEAYRGLVGAYRFAFAASSSIVFRAYVLISAVIGVYTAMLLGLGVVVWLENPIVFGERGVLFVIGLLILVPLASPVLIIARRYRRASSTPEHDRVLAIAGYMFIASLFLALAISDPAGHGPSEIARIIDAVPSSVGLVLPVIAIGIMAIAVRYTREEQRADDGPRQAPPRDRESSK